MKFFFYGTLKKGQYNCTRCLEGRKGVSFVKEATTPASFQLWSLGPYPCMTPGDQEVPGEIWDVDNDDVIDFVEYMESGAGYTNLQFRTKCGETVWTYIWTEEAAKKVGWQIPTWPPPTDREERPASREAHLKAAHA